MKQENNCALPQEGAFRTTIGGQALIEGILMRGPEKQAIVVRNQEGELEVKEQTLKLIKDRYPILGLPFLRGVVNFLASLVEGVKALMWSAEFYPDEEEEKPPSKFETWLEKHFGNEGLMKWIIGFSVVVGIAFAIALFIILPTLATSALLYFFPDAPMWLRNLLEGVLKLVIFFLYLFLCSRLKDIHRTFQYHGAEHKTIFCYERGLELTVENARRMPRHHPRCGTSFLFVVIVVAVLVDLSDGALDLCKRNIRRHKLTGRAVSLKGDALQAPSHALGQFDVLVCNPPYIPTGDLAALDTSVKDFEPLLALDGGEDGLDFYRGITELWQPALKPGGHLLYEVGIGQAEKVAWLLVKAGYENIRITRDTGGIDRVVEGQRPKEREIPDMLHETMEEDV